MVLLQNSRSILREAVALRLDDTQRTEGRITPSRYGTTSKAMLNVMIWMPHWKSWKAGCATTSTVTESRSLQ